jgi:tetratricopeptide (TPR) repeat protein
VAAFTQLAGFAGRALSVGLLVLLPGQRPLWAHPGADAALAYFNQEIQARPGDQALYIQRGVTYSNGGQWPQARADFERAETMGDPILVAFDFGVLHYRSGDFEAARRSFDAFLQRFPDHAPCLEYRARLLHDAGDYPAAVADFRRLFELQARPNPGHYISAAQMLRSMGPDGIDKALALIDQGNEKLGTTPQLQRYAMELELARQRPDRAIARVRSLEPLLGESPEWKVNMAELMLEVGQGEQAAALLDAAAAQLETLRMTPARLALRQRVEGLRGQLPR